MKSLILASVILTSVIAQATEAQKSFTCKNANGAVVMTEAKLTYPRFISMKRVDIVTRQNLDTDAMPAAGSLLLFGSSQEQADLEMDIVKINSLSERQEISRQMDKGGYGVSIITESYKIAVELTVSGEAQAHSISMDCVEKTELDNR